MEDDFEEFWNSYPIRKNVLATRESWRIALKKVSPEIILKAVKEYASDPHRDPTYTPYPARWLDEERWLDGPNPPRRLTEQEVREKELHNAYLRDEAERRRSEVIAEEFRRAKEQSVPMPESVKADLIAKGIKRVKDE